MKLHEAIKQAAVRGGAWIVSIEDAMPRRFWIEANSESSAYIARCRRYDPSWAGFSAREVCLDWTIEPERFGPEDALRRYIAGKKVTHPRMAGYSTLGGIDLRFSKDKMDERWEELP